VKLWTYESLPETLLLRSLKSLRTDYDDISGVLLVNLFERMHHNQSLILICDVENLSRAIPIQRDMPDVGLVIYYDFTTSSFFTVMIFLPNSIRSPHAVFINLRAYDI